MLLSFTYSYVLFRSQRFFALKFTQTLFPLLLTKHTQETRCDGIDLYLMRNQH